MSEIHPALAEALRADRDALNEKFVQRKRAGVRIDEPAFQEHLRTGVNDLIGAVARVRHDRVRVVLLALFDVSLDLFAAGLLGPKVKHSHVAAVWRDLLPAAARLLALEPTRVAGSLSNAADHLAAYPSARPGEWIDGMRKLAADCDAVAAWLDAGKVLAWRAGLVQYREAALKLARAMPWKLAARCFDIAVTEDVWLKHLARMESDRWYAPNTSGRPSPFGRGAGGEGTTLRIVRTIGGFRGFGGPCLKLPMVAVSDANLVVMDGVGSWQLFADVFGTMWLPIDALHKPRKQGAASIDKNGRVTWGKTRHDFPQLAEATSFACDEQTLAVTLPTSYHVFLVAR
ncbi:MAG TPA: hypothetical protein VFE62_12480 [Gemmataceae bacterium]|nr:hypothetical protein [Gemmataceae bacterium]